MASLISGYEYDIFISYRQKDNKGDMWVSKFIEALKTELEATFKEDVSVYFDENPHDRLQETHNVDKSLEGKLKCLIFIPILSQTYCDPNSYAWQYEFLVFNKLAREDQFGRDIRLRNGNYASRILPIRIHDLEQEDVKLFEKETGSVLRALDFVFKTASGTIRPLLPNEDHPNDNLNKTFYRDQISKVALAIKEIILGMKAEPVPLVKEKAEKGDLLEEVRKEEKMEVQERPVRTSKRKVLIGSIAIAVLLVIAVILVFQKFFKRDTLENLRSSDGRISIAVMPFQNLTNDTLWNVWQDGIQEILTTSLSNYQEEIIVRGTESINSMIQSKGFNSYASIAPSLASSISKKLDADIFVFGNLIQYGGKIRVSAKLYNSLTKDSFKSFQLDGPAEEIILISDSLSAQIRDFLLISKLQKESGLSQNKSFTNSPLAFEYYCIGLNAARKTDYLSAINWFMKALAVDSNFMEAEEWIVAEYWNKKMYADAKMWCINHYKKKDKMSLRDKLMADYYYALLFKIPLESIKYLRQIQEMDNQQPGIIFNIGQRYSNISQYDKAIPEYEKALELNDKLNLKSQRGLYVGLISAYHKTGEYKKSKKLLRRAEQDFPDDTIINMMHVVGLLTDGDIDEAISYSEKHKSVRDKSAAENALSWAFIYSAAGILDKAEEYYRQALSFEPANPVGMNTIAYFLIDKERNINEGMELIDSVLIKSPDNYNYMHTKGWGLYKQGKYKEALEILQKSWDIRREKAVYDHEALQHLEDAKKAVASQKNN